MKTHEILSLVAVVFLLAAPMVSYAETREECKANCVARCSALGSGKAYETCLENCLKRCYDKLTGIPEIPPPTTANPSQKKSERELSVPIPATVLCVDTSNTEKAIAEAKKYNFLCTKCGNGWVSTGKPTKCPNPSCGSKQIIYKESENMSGNIVNKKDLVASENCVCASCNRPCGSGHEPWCKYAPKINTPITIETEPGVPRISCTAENAVPPLVLSKNFPCPGGVYCNWGNCGEFCCPWGWFYSNPCTCKCYKTSYDAGADCNTYFRCQ